MTFTFKSALARLLRLDDAPYQRECADIVARLQAMAIETPTEEEGAARYALATQIIICADDARLADFLKQRGYTVKPCDLEGHEECGLLFYEGHETHVIAHMQVGYRSLLDISETLSAIEGHNASWPKYLLSLRERVDNERG